MCQVFFFHHKQHNCFVWWYIDYMSKCCEVALVTRSLEVSVALRVIGLARSTSNKAVPRLSSPLWVKGWMCFGVFACSIFKIWWRRTEWANPALRGMFTQCTTLLLNANSLLPVFNTEPPLWALQRFRRSRLLSENYSDALQVLVRSWRGKTSPAGHLTGSWNKEAHKPLRQHPSDHDKYAICKTRTAEVYTLGVWAGRVKHICVSASGDLSSHAARWLVLVLSWFVYPGQLK